MGAEHDGPARGDRRGFGTDRATITIGRGGIVVVSGEIDADNADRLALALADPDCDVLDASRVTFFGAAGLRVLMTAARAQPTGRLALRAPSVAVTRLLAVAGVERLFLTIDGRQAADTPTPR